MGFAIMLLVPYPSGGNVQPPVLSKYTIKLHPVDDMLEFCAEVFNKMIDLAVQPELDLYDFSAEQDQAPHEVTVTIVTPPEGFTYRYMDDWMHNHHASRGTLTQLCTWREQHIERAEGFGNVVAFGTIFMMGITSRTPKSFVPYSHRWGEVPRLSIRPNEATWRAGSSFLAVLDADNPSS